MRPFSITTDGELSFATKKYVPLASLTTADFCEKGEVLFNNTNSIDLVGKTTVFDVNCSCAVSNHITRLKLKDGVDPYYVAAFFNMLLRLDYWKFLCTNFNNQSGINNETLKKVRIILPDIKPASATYRQRRASAPVPIFSSAFRGIRSKRTRWSQGYSACRWALPRWQGHPAAPCSSTASCRRWQDRTGR